MKTQLILLCFVGCLLAGCDRSKPISNIPDKKSNFQRLIFKQLDSGATVTLVSETECEISEDHEIFLAEYSRQENKLRLILRKSGATSVVYYEIIPDGLRNPSTNEVFLLPEPYARAIDARQKANEAAILEREKDYRLQEAIAEKHRRANARNAEMLLGKWVQEKGGTMEFSADGTGITEAPGGFVVNFKWTVNDDVIKYIGLDSILNVHDYGILEITTSTLTLCYNYKTYTLRKANTPADSSKVNKYEGADANHLTSCSFCDGKGIVIGGAKCPVCNGMGVKPK